MSAQPQADLPVCAFRGINRPGIGVSGMGRRDEDAAALAERLFNQGYRSATVRDRAGREVGYVGPNDGGQRIWWGETSDGVRSLGNDEGSA